MAHKKGLGSSRNGRDSRAQRGRKCDGHLVFTRGVKRRIHVRPLEAEEAEA